MKSRNLELLARVRELAPLAAQWMGSGWQVQVVGGADVLPSLGLRYACEECSLSQVMWLELDENGKPCPTFPCSEIVWKMLGPVPADRQRWASVLLSEARRAIGLALLELL